jgi:predicted protein tyrosine phosphatase
MNHQQLAILGYSEASMFLKGISGSDVAAIISIHGAREFGVQSDINLRLDLNFDDVEVAPDHDLMAIQSALSRKRWNEANNLVEIAPRAEDAASIIEFAGNLRDQSGIVLCHCAGGMSRAPAAALICLAVWRGPGTEAECVAEVRKLRDGAVPHIGLLRFADELLNRGGLLVDALAAAGR